VRINWQGPGHAVRMTGPAALVFEGQIETVSPRP
jgi:diaminopimelate epimerase